VAGGSTLLAALGGEPGCRRLSAEFYARVGRDPVLRPFFPGKTLRCAIEEFAAFLVQFLGGDEEQTQKRWWLSLRGSHDRFPIGPAERAAWLRQMRATLEAFPLDLATRKALQDFFDHSSSYVIGRETATPVDQEVAARWRDQRELDAAVAAIAGGRHQEALTLTQRFASRPVVFLGLLAGMVESGDPDWTEFVLDAIKRDPAMATRRWAGRSLLHYASGAGRLEVVNALLSLGTDPDLRDAGGHTPLYRVANQCASPQGRDVVLALLRSGADVNARNGVTRATALHMAARRGFVEIARTLLDSGADRGAVDKKGDTPLARALNCRKGEVAELLSRHSGL
jgi:hemoglobin